MKKMILIGGDCSLSGLNEKGEEIFWNVCSDKAISLCI